jgi:hypothetical protein
LKFFKMALHDGPIIEEKEANWWLRDGALFIFGCAVRVRKLLETGKCRIFSSSTSPTQSLQAVLDQATWPS